MTRRGSRGPGRFLVGCAVAAAAVGAGADEIEPDAALVPSAAAVGDGTGTAADLADGFAVVGSPGHGAGRLTLFQHAGGDWLEQAALDPPDGAEPGFGGVAATGTGLYAAGAGGQDGEVAYVFTAFAATPLEATLRVPEGGAARGEALAVSGDAVLVGCPAADGDAGAAYVFRRLGGVSGLAFAPPRTSGAADADPYTAVIGTDTRIVSATVTFRETVTGTTRMAYLVGDVLEGDGVDPASGIDRVTGELRVAAVENDVADATVRVQWSDAVEWAFEAKLAAADATAQERLGASVALARDVALVGAPGRNSALVFRRGAGGAWTEEAELTAPATGALGSSVALSLPPGAQTPDGALVVSASGPPGGTPEEAQAGAAFVYRRTDGAWSEPVRLAAPGVDGPHGGGAIEGDAAVTTANGAAYVHARIGEQWFLRCTISPPAGAGAFRGARLSAGRLLLHSVAPTDGSASWSGGARLYSGAGTPDTAEGWVRCASARAKPHPRKADRSTFSADGQMDLGRAEAVEAPAVLQVGGFTIDVPEFAVTRRGQLRHAAEGVSITLTPGPAGSSRVAFALQITGDLTDRIPLDGDVPITFADARGTVSGLVRLEGGRQAAGPVPDPRASVVGARAVLRGEGRDSLTLTLQAPSVSVAERDLTVAFAGWTATLPSASFRGRRGIWTLRAPVGPVTKAVVDVERGEIRIEAARTTLPAFAEGANDVLVGLLVGDAVHSARVRMARAGTRFDY